MELAAKLLTTAGILMLLAGVLFGVTQQWLYASLICIGAFGCLAGAMNFRNWKKIVKESETIQQSRERPDEITTDHSKAFPAGEDTQ